MHLPAPLQATSKLTQKRDGRAHLIQQVGEGRHSALVHFVHMLAEQRHALTVIQRWVARSPLR